MYRYYTHLWFYCELLVTLHICYWFLLLWLNCDYNVNTAGCMRSWDTMHFSRIVYFPSSIRWKLPTMLNRILSVTWLANHWSLVSTKLDIWWQSPPSEHYLNIVQSSSANNKITTSICCYSVTGMAAWQPCHLLPPKGFRSPNMYTS